MSKNGSVTLDVTSIQRELAMAEADEAAARRLYNEAKARTASARTLLSMVEKCTVADRKSRSASSERAKACDVATRPGTKTSLVLAKAVEVLRSAGKPLPALAILKRLDETGNGQLIFSARQDDPFARVNCLTAFLSTASRATRPAIVTDKTTRPQRYALTEAQARLNV